MSVAVTLLAGVTFGLALAAPPGPMNAIIAEESVLRGWLAGFKAGLGAATADACFLALALLGVVTFVERFALVRALMVAAGGLLMLYFAWGAIRDARRAFTPDTAEGPRVSAPVGDDGSDRGILGNVEGGKSPPVPAGPGKGFRKAFVLALTNPYQILFWLTVGVGLLEPGTVDVLVHASDALAGVLVVHTGTPALLVGLFAGIGVWIVGFPAGLVAVGRRVNALGPAVAYLSSIVLAGFGVFFLADAAGALLGSA